MPGTFFSLNSIRSNRYRSWWDLEAVILKPISAISTFQYPLFASTVEMAIDSARGSYAHPWVACDMSLNWLVRLVFCSQHRIARHWPFSGRQDWCSPFRSNWFDIFLLEHLGDFNALKFAYFWTCSIWCRVYRSCFRGEISTIFCQTYFFSVVIPHIWEWFEPLDEFLPVLKLFVGHVNSLSPVRTGLLRLWRLDLFMALHLILSVFSSFVMHCG